MTTPQLTDERIAEIWREVKASYKVHAREHTPPIHIVFARALLAQPSVAQLAPGGDVVAPKPTQERNENFVPGVMHCAKCRFRLNRINLNVNVGTVTAGDNKTEPCPNGCGPLWPITWEQEAREGYAALKAERDAALARVAELEEAALEGARRIESLKRECSAPESPIAIQNGRYMNVSYFLRAAITKGQP